MDNKQSVSLRVVLAFSKNLVHLKNCLLDMKFSLKLKFS